MHDPSAPGTPVAIHHPYLHPDLVVYLDPETRFEPGTVTVARGQELRPGAGAYTGAMLHHLGHRVRYFDRVGDDLFGDFTLRQLAAWGHDVSGVVRYAGASQVCASIADVGTLGGTMVITYPPAWQQDLDQARDLIVAAGDGPQLTYVWSWYWSYAHQPLAGAPTAELVALAARGSQLLLLDPNWKPAGDPPRAELDQLRRALPDVDLFKPNVRDARLLVGDRPRRDLVTAVLELGPRTVVITDGADGCLVASQDDPTVVHVPAPDLPVRDTTGAGDYLGGALLSAVDGGRSAVEAVAFATAASTSTISRDQGADLPAADAFDQLGRALLDRTEELR